MRSWKASERSVTAQSVIIPPTIEGIVNKLVSKVPKPIRRNERVRYWVGGVAGMPNVNPL